MVMNYICLYETPVSSSHFNSLTLMSMFTILCSFPHLYTPILCQKLYSNFFKPFLFKMGNCFSISCTVSFRNSFAFHLFGWHLSASVIIWSGTENVVGVFMARLSWYLNPPWLITHFDLKKPKRPWSPLWCPLMGVSVNGKSKCQNRGPMVQSELWLFYLTGRTSIVPLWPSSSLFWPSHAHTGPWALTEI